ncbi:MAG: helix-turn-helix domain-containing protein [Eubacterium sp.]|nr:helix-turn-helix domain-containing protein [Eubacterium sp.]
MNIQLSDNIRTFRKERGLTQEKLAEVLGVTVGAVYKWEAGLSVPEITTLVEIADFFDISIDVLFGYEMKDNRKATVLKRIIKSLGQKDMNGLAEAEKALKKYPNIFDIVYWSGIMYMTFGMEGSDGKLIRRGIELLESSKLLMSQNTNPRISSLSITGSIAQGYVKLGESERAIKLLKENNPNGIYDSVIGIILANYGKRSNEAGEVLTEALLGNMSNMMNISIGFIKVYLDEKRYDNIRDMTEWSIEYFGGLKRSDKPFYLDKIISVLYVYKAFAELMLGDNNSSNKSLKQGIKTAEAFDANPDYSMDSIRFTNPKGYTAHDDLGTTATEGIEGIIKEINNSELKALWDIVKYSF